MNDAIPTSTVTRWIGLVLDAAAVVGIEVHDISAGRLTLDRRPEINVYGSNVDEAAARALADILGATDVVMGKPYGSGPQANLTAKCDGLDIDGFDLSVLVTVLPPEAKLASVSDEDLAAERERRRHEATAGPDRDPAPDGVDQDGAPW